MNRLEKYQKLFSDYADTIGYDDTFKNLYDPIAYTLNNKGKRLRPVVLLMTCEAFGRNIEEALPAALAIEVFHNFTLLHDDIMDVAPIRRGKPSVFKKYGTNAAILSGDAMLIQSYRYLESYEPVLFMKLMTIYSNTAIGVCEGQQLDIDFETTMDVSIASYLKMIELKTAVLIAGAMQLGALIGGATDEAAKHFYDFGKNLGIAFQLQDDILDTYGEEEKIGKQQGGDILQKKKTYLYLKTQELLEGEEKKEFVHLYNGDTDNKVTDVIKWFDQVVVKEYANQVKEAYLDLAYSHLSAIGLDPEKEKSFQQFSQSLVDREF